LNIQPWHLTLTETTSFFKKAKGKIEHLKILDKAINIDKINVKGYFHWALIDNYEWASGFKMKFGLYAIDHTTKSRIQRKSAEVFKNIIETKAFH